MWTGTTGKLNKTTTAAAAAPFLTEGSKTKTYANERREAELETLRQRGLATIFHQHFTSITRALAEERAAADEALRDLEARKAAAAVARQRGMVASLSPSDSNTDDVGGDPSAAVWDEMYLDVQQKNAECKRLEREFLVLYQHYVDRFGVPRAVVTDVGRPDVSSDNDDDDSMGDDFLSSDTPTTTTTKAILAEHMESTTSKDDGCSNIKLFQDWNKSQQDAFIAMDAQERVAFLISLEEQEEGQCSIDDDGRLTTTTPTG